MSAYRPVAIEDDSPGGLSLAFGYDAASNLTKLGTAAGITAPDITFDYDTLGRLTATKDGPTQAAIDSYIYDATGNRLSHTTAAGTSTYTYPGTRHHLTDVGGTARTYDDVGNTTAIGSARVFTYSDANRMSQVSNGGTVAMNYGYSGRGEQVRRYIGTVNTYTVYDEAGHWLGDYDGSGVPLQQALWMDDLPVGLLANSAQLHYIEPDHLGSPRVAVEVARNVAVWKWDLKGEAFGSTAPEQDVDGDAVPLVLDMRFPGQRFDASSGLNYNYFRDYDQGAGRYVQSDPLGLNGGITTYAYTSSWPIQAIDVYGLEWIEYTGIKATLYGGSVGDRQKELVRCWAASGKNVPNYYDYRNTRAQNIKDYGPIPEGSYWINLVPNPARVANISPNGNLFANTGIEKIPGIGQVAWGTLRARLEKMPGTTAYDRDNFYIHDSQKGETSGCIETCTSLIKNLIEIRSTGVKGIEVIVDYPNGRDSWTHGP